MKCLVLNCGSSSAKFAVVDAQAGRELVSGLAQRLGTPEATLDVKLNGATERRPIPGAGHDGALRASLELLREQGLADGLRGVGHRVVHGGARFSGSRLVDDEVLGRIEACIPLGPLHNPPNLLGIKVAQELLPGLPQVAVFDTAFHQTMPSRAYLYPVPYDWYEQHQVRRYGFHGTSHRYVAQQAVRQLGLHPDDHAIVTAHLGNGCSCAAVRDGRSVDTTMGLTPLEGLVMGTRSGSIDPAMIGHMGRALGLEAEQVLDLLNKKSGLLGLSGLSNDMRTLQEAALAGHDRARLAIDVFCYVLAKSIAALVVPLRRLDALVFTGGIGENSAAVRAAVLAELRFLGLVVDPAANRAHGREQGGRITLGSLPMAAVVPTNEELMIAMDTAEIVASVSRAVA
ncbi:MAG TPA: acetate kinase [Anaeromyxobacteraceae bacterium]|nr:acetate kinase [Anaeromyxobacteraceae bacterium]